MSNKSNGQQALGLIGFIVLVAGAIIVSVQVILKGDLGMLTQIVTLMSYFVVAWVGWNFVAGKKRYVLIIYIISIVVIATLLVLQICGVLS